MYDLLIIHSLSLSKRRSNLVESHIRLLLLFAYGACISILKFIAGSTDFTFKRMIQIDDFQYLHILST